MFLTVCRIRPYNLSRPWQSLINILLVSPLLKTDRVRKFASQFGLSNPTLLIFYFFLFLCIYLLIFYHTNSRIASLTSSVSLSFTDGPGSQVRLAIGSLKPKSSHASTFILCIYLLRIHHTNSRIASHVLLVFFSFTDVLGSQVRFSVEPCFMFLHSSYPLLKLNKLTSNLLFWSISIVLFVSGQGLTRVPFLFRRTRFASSPPSWVSRAIFFFRVNLNP